MGFPLTEEQRAAVDNRGGGLLVSAAAGSGKTKVLVERLLGRVTEEGENLDHFLIITYTKAAAAELRGKILDSLNERLAEYPDDRHLRRQTTLIYQAQISTIHSFCQMVLRENGYQIDLDSDFRVADDTACQVLRDRVFTTVMERHYETVTPGDDFSCLLDTMAAGRDDYKLREMVMDIHAKVQSHPDPAGWLRAQAQTFRLEGVTDVGETPWGRLLLEDALEQTEYWSGQMTRLLDLLDADEKLSVAYSPAVCDLMDSLDDFADGLKLGWDRAVLRADLNFGKLKPARKVEDAALQERAKALREACKGRMKKVTDRFQRTSEQLLEDLRGAAPAVIALLELVEEFDVAFAAEKRRRKLVDFSDLEHLALKVLVDEGGAPTAAARRYSQRFCEVMVDEYQDTNQVQNAIFSAVSGQGKKLFMVGDVKQSIYRFRLADPTIFLEKLRTFPYAPEAGEGEGRKLVLTKNFRSRRTVLEGTNFLFRTVMSPAFGEIEYTQDHYLNPGLCYPDQPNDHIELDVVDMSQMESEEDEEKIRRSQVEAGFVAKRVRRLMDEGFLVTQGDGLRPAQWEDIVILHRSPGTVLRELTQALDAQRVPWQADGGADFFSASEVCAAISFLEIIDNPHQDVPLISVLRAPVYAFSVNRLAEIRAGCKEGDFYTALRASEDRDPACAAFLTELEALRFRSVDCRAGDLLWELYTRTGMLAVYSALDGGEMRRDNLLLLYEYARQYEQAGHKGVFGFVTQLRRMKESGRTITVGGGMQGGGVRIMSIHKSKGLEFPVVVLAGLTRRFNRMDETRPMLFHPELGVGPKGLNLEQMVEYPTLARTAVAFQLERELCAEELRLLYVAMTRAREKLILICALQNAEKTCAALAAGANSPMEPQALAAMSSMGEWILSAVTTREEGAILRFGAQPESLWHGRDPSWEIHVYDGEHTERRYTLRNHVAQEGQRVQGALPNRETLLAQLTWSDPRMALADIPSKLTATQIKGRFPDEEIAEDTAQPLRELVFDRPQFARAERGLTPAERGTALHLFMQLCDAQRASTISGAREEIARLVRMNCLTPEQGKACDGRKAAAFFASPLGQEALEHQAYREFKFSILTDAQSYYGDVAQGEQVLLQGVIDLWFETVEGITVVDFKTDHIAPGGERARAEEYRRQLETYSAALSRITGRPIARRCLWFFHTNTPVEL